MWNAVRNMETEHSKEKQTNAKLIKAADPQAAGGREPYLPEKSRT